MLTIDSLQSAERFVTKQQRLGNDVRWDNYDIVFFRPEVKGMYSKHGAFRDGEWGFENRSEINEDGTWSVDWRNVKRAERTRN